MTNLDNGKSVEARVNDRGPFARNCIFGLSYGAAQRLHAVGDGVTRVRLPGLGLPA